MRPRRRPGTGRATPIPDTRPAPAPSGRPRAGPAPGHRPRPRRSGSAARRSSLSRLLLPPPALAERGGARHPDDLDERRGPARAVAATLEMEDQIEGAQELLAD